MKLESESFFSVAENFVTNIRNRMSNEFLYALIILKANFFKIIILLHHCMYVLEFMKFNLKTFLSVNTKQHELVFLKLFQ